MSDDSNVKESNFNGYLLMNNGAADASVRPMMREPFTKLRFALSKPDRLELTDAMVNAATKDKSSRPMASTLVNRLVSGVEIAASYVQLPFDMVAHRSGEWKTLRRR